MQDAFANSFPGGNSKENGGTIVQDKDGNILVVNEGGAGSTSGTFSPDRNIAPDQTLVGTFHTHPYDESEGGHKGVAFSADDMANSVEQKEEKLVDAGDKQFMITPTDQTPPVDRDKMKKDWQDAFDKASGEGKSFPEASRAAAAEVARKNNMAYYEGEDGNLQRVD